MYAFSPDGHWALLAQIAMSTTPDPAVVETKEHRFVDSLRGHGGTVLSISFSRDGSKVVTACEDGKVRVFSVPAWTLLRTLTGHNGPVHWAEFSPDGKWVASVARIGPPAFGPSKTASCSRHSKRAAILSSPLVLLLTVRPSQHPRRRLRGCGNGSRRAAGLSPEGAGYKAHANGLGGSGKRVFHFRPKP